MKNMREIAGNFTMIGGLLTSAGSVVDAVVNKALIHELNQRSRITETVGAKYGVEQECTGSIFSSPATFTCFDVVSGKTAEEEKKILDQYKKDLTEEQNKLPMNTRGYGDLIGFTAGIVVVAGGNALKQKKEK